MSDEKESRRLFIGGLRPDVTASELGERFTPFGDVLGVEFIRDDKDVPRGFAYVDMVISMKNLVRAQSMYSKATWKGMTIKVAEAKKNYLVRLQESWRACEQAVEAARLRAEKRIVKATKKSKYHLKGQAPMTDDAASGAEGWVVGRFGRALPVLTIRKPGARRPIKSDPKKMFTRIKRFADDDADDCLGAAPSALTWDLPERAPRAVPVWDGDDAVLAAMDYSDTVGTALRGEKRQALEVLSRLGAATATFRAVVPEQPAVSDSDDDGVAVAVAGAVLVPAVKRAVTNRTAAQRRMDDGGLEVVARGAVSSDDEVWRAPPPVPVPASRVADALSSRPAALDAPEPSDDGLEVVARVAVGAPGACVGGDGESDSDDGMPTRPAPGTSRLMVPRAAAVARGLDGVGGSRAAVAVAATTPPVAGAATTPTVADDEDNVDDAMSEGRSSCSSSDGGDTAGGLTAGGRAIPIIIDDAVGGDGNRSSSDDDAASTASHSSTGSATSTSSRGGVVAGTGHGAAGRGAAVAGGGEAASDSGTSDASSAEDDGRASGHGHAERTAPHNGGADPASSDAHTSDSDDSHDEAGPHAHPHAAPANAIPTKDDDSNDSGSTDAGSDAGSASDADEGPADTSHADQDGSGDDAGSDHASDHAGSDHASSGDADSDAQGDSDDVHSNHGRDNDNEAQPAAAPSGGRDAAGRSAFVSSGLLAAVAARPGARTVVRPFSFFGADEPVAVSVGHAAGSGSEGGATASKGDETALRDEPALGDGRRWRMFYREKDLAAAPHRKLFASSYIHTQEVQAPRAGRAILPGGRCRGRDCALGGGAR